MPGDFMGADLSCDVPAINKHYVLPVRVRTHLYLRGTRKRSQYFCVVKRQILFQAEQRNNPIHGSSIHMGSCQTLSHPSRDRALAGACGSVNCDDHPLSLIHISEPTRRTPISYAVFCLKK